MKLLKNHAFIDGEWVKSANSATYTVINPANGDAIARVPDMGVKETKLAIETAARAFTTWRAKSAKQRSEILKRWNDLVLRNQEELAKIVTKEGGKPINEALGEVTYAASFIEWFAEEGKRAYGDITPPPTSDKRLLTIKQPIGVCAAITPWNFPVAMITRKVSPALAVGCSVVVKPASATPLSALALAALGQEAGLPKGILNVVTSRTGEEVGKEMCANPIIRKLSFTGSTHVGKILLKQCAGTVKRVSMELGGNAPFIVFDDANLDDAVEGAMASKYRNSGQTCVCANRLLVQSSVYDEFCAKFASTVAKLRVGDGSNSSTTQGPLINSSALEKVEHHVADAIKKGAKIVCGGKKHERGGNFYQPTILANVTDDMLIAKEEIFGPVAPLFRFENEQEAIAMANDTEFGLAAYFYSNDVNRIIRISESLEYGMVGINTGIISTELAPFGGIKESGMGLEGSKYGLEEYLETKYLCLGGVS